MAKGSNQALTLNKSDQAGEKKKDFLDDSNDYS